MECYWIELKFLFYKTIDYPRLFISTHNQAQSEYNIQKSPCQFYTKFQDCPRSTLCFMWSSNTKHEHSLQSGRKIDAYQLFLIEHQFYPIFA